jgi:hypothetical protein
MAIKKIFLLMLMAFAAFDSFAQDAYLPVNLGNKVNSRYSELTPIISADGRELYFLREMFRKAANEEIQSLWYSKQDEKGEWGLARYMAAPFNNGLTHSAITNVSPDNNTIIIKGYFKNGTRVTGTGYSVVTRNANGGWKTPVGIEIEGFADLVKGKYVGATLTPDGKAMMFYFSEEKEAPIMIFTSPSKKRMAVLPGRRLLRRLTPAMMMHRLLWRWIIKRFTSVATGPAGWAITTFTKLPGWMIPGKNGVSRLTLVRR